MSKGNLGALDRRALLMKWGWRTACLILVAALTLGGYRAGRKQHLAKQMESFAARGDFKSAVLVARRLFDLDPNSLTAARAMAEMAEKCARSDAIEWRRKIAHLEPLPANQIALARTALRFGRRDLARAALRALPETARQGAEYHQAAGAEALARRDRAEAEEHFAAALQNAPQDPQLALNLAAVRLTSPERSRRDEARENLGRLTNDARVRLAALRALAADALVHKNQSVARQWTTQLRNEKEVTLADLLLHFEAVAGSDQAARALDALQRKGAESPAAAAELITFLNRHDLAQVAAFWACALPSRIAEAHPVPLAIAESYSILQDWTALRKQVEGKNWRELEALRLAVHSHALQRLSPPGRPSIEAQTAWANAVQAAQSRPEQLLAIAQLAEGWGYQAEAEAVWWKLATSQDNATLALSALQRLYKAKQDTRGLLRVAKRALELNPDDLVAANNYASLGLLLNGDGAAARRLASKLHSEHPTNRAFTATYAFALHSEGKIAEGVKVMESLKVEELRQPALAAYYVVMLVDHGDLARARSYLSHAERARLLPEERQLLNTAARKLL
jgi:predicted Zn-dependent protease